MTCSSGGWEVQCQGIVKVLASGKDLVATSAQEGRTGREQEGTETPFCNGTNPSHKNGDLMASLSLKVSSS